MSKRTRVAYESVVMQFDGASKSNPGPSGAGWCIFAPDGKGIGWGYKFIGPKETNNVAEYKALLGGLKQLSTLNTESILIQGDSKLVIEQVNGKWKCKAVHLQPLLKEARAVLATLSCKATLQHIPREKNTWADHLSNVATLGGEDQDDHDDEDDTVYSLSYFRGKLSSRGL